MQWYIAKLVFNIKISNGVHQSQFDEQLRLVEAGSAGDAFFKARLLGKKEEDSFHCENGEEVTWKFIDVADIQPLNAIKHGAEIYSYTREDQPAADYINYIRRKAQALQVKDIIFA